MPPDDLKAYAKLKDAILRRYDINEEGYRQRFRSAASKPGETNREFRARLSDLAKKWMRSENCGGRAGSCCLGTTSERTTRGHSSLGEREETKDQ